MVRHPLLAFQKIDFLTVVRVMKDRKMRKLAFLVVLTGLTAPLLPVFSAGFGELPGDAIVVRIDGNGTTKAKIEQMAKTSMTLAMNKQRRKKVGSSEKRLYQKACKVGPSMLVNRGVVAKYAVLNGLTNSAETVSNVISKFERQYGVRSRVLKRWHTIDDLKYMLKGNAALVDEEIKARATYQTVTNHILSAGSILITDEMVSNRIESVARMNARIAATNEFVHVSATNVWRKIVAKEQTFEDAAKKYSEDIYISSGCEWGTFEFDNLSDETELLKLLPTMKVGDMTAPIESDGGLAIIRLDEVDQNREYTFSRVYFRLPMFFTVETPDEARAFLREEAEKKLIETKLDAVKATMKIEYPSGTNLFAAASSSAGGKKSVSKR